MRIKENRAELHCHTNMSGGLYPVRPEELLKKCRELGVDAVAVTDRLSVQAFPEIYRRKLAGSEPVKIIYGYEGFLEQKGRMLRPITILVKTQEGLKNLYRLVSYANLHSNGGLPMIPESVLSENRQGLLIGIMGLPSEVGPAFDYVEVTPAMEPEEVKNILGRSKVPVIAVGDVRYLDPEGLKAALAYAGFSGQKADENAEEHILMGTEEMLSHFSFLGKEKAREIVVETPGKIAGMIEDVVPVNSVYHPIRLPGSEKTVRETCKRRMKELYGDMPPSFITDRLSMELGWILERGYADLFYLATLLSEKAKKDGYPVMARGCAASSFAAFLLGITEVNPLPAHRRCECGYAEQDPGAHLSEKICPVCGKKMVSDGWDIPAESFFGLNGEKEPDFDLNFSPAYRDRAIRYLEEIFPGETLRAGTIGTLFDETAGYIAEESLSETQSARESMAAALSGAKMKEGTHPGGILLIPEGTDIHEITPVSVEDGEKRSHFNYHDIDKNLYKLDLLPHDTPEKLKRLWELTGICPESINVDDRELLSLFRRPREEDGQGPYDTFGIPEFDSEFAWALLDLMEPESAEDLMRICAIRHGTGVWFGNGEKLVLEGTSDFSELITSRDDIFLYLKEKGFDRETSFRIMEEVRKGRIQRGKCKEWPLWKEEMRSRGIPDWYAVSCEKMMYLFPKAHTVTYVLMSLRLAWYKLHYPEEFQKVTEEMTDRRNRGKWPYDENLLKTKLSMDELGPRFWNLLKRTGFETVGDLLSLSPGQVLTMFYTGQRNRRDIFRYILSLDPEWQCNYRGERWNAVFSAGSSWILMTDEIEIALAALHGDVDDTGGNSDREVDRSYERVIFDNGFSFTESELRHLRGWKTKVILMHRGPLSSALSEKREFLQKEGIPVLEAVIGDSYAAGGFFDSWLLIPPKEDMDAFSEESEKEWNKEKNLKKYFL